MYFLISIENLKKPLIIYLVCFLPSSPGCSMLKVQEKAVLIYKLVGGIGIGLNKHK